MTKLLLLSALLLNCHLAMSKVFKYQELMIEKGIAVPCPYKNCEEGVMEKVYRWGLEPKEHELNFLPNFLYNERKPNPKPIRFLGVDDLKNCSNCSLSLFISADTANKFWNVIGPRVRSLLEYTHILEGKIDRSTGVITKTKPHFELFEYKGVELREDFEVLIPLSVD